MELTNFFRTKVFQNKPIIVIPISKYLLIGIIFIAQTASAGELFVFFGTHASGANKGFSVARFDTVSGILTTPKFITEAAAPAFFVIHPDGKHLYSCNSIDSFAGQASGAISAYSIDPLTTRLTLINQKPTGGSNPSYISLDASGRFALVANYNGGNIAVISIKPDGSLGERTAFIQHTGSSIHPVRQTMPHAHSIKLDPLNRFALVCDLGLDKVFVYRFDQKTGSLAPNDPPFAQITPGSGPRHLAFHPNGRIVYVMNEISSTVGVFAWDPQQGKLSELQTVSALPSDFKGVNTSAEIAVHPNGKFLYCTNRGHDSMAVFAIDPVSGHLTLIENIATQGHSPRNFTFDPTGRWIIVTNHGSDNAMVFRVDEHTGKLTPTGNPVTVAYPFCERFLVTQ
jgi:6-phosphogluconolactonase